MFEAQYNNTLSAVAKTYAENDSNDLVVERPERTPENVWASLDLAQRRVATVQCRQRRISARLRDMLTDQDRIQMIYGDQGVTEADAKTLAALWSVSLKSDSNPTCADTASYIVDARTRGVAPKFLLTQCIKSPDVKKNDFLRFCGQEAPKPERFVRGLDPKGWMKMRALLDACPGSSVDLMLGDMDFYTLDRCPHWWPGCEAQIRAEALALNADIQAKADEFFGRDRARVQLWSEQYDSDMFDAELERVRASEAWRTPAWLKASRKQYVQWGYRASEKQCITEGMVDAFRIDGEERTRAGYKIEARIAIARNVIQCWAEAGDVLAYSDYDGSGLPPSLILAS